MPIKVLLDTDIGSDVDDAICLAYLLAQPACDLLAITTVTGEPVRRAMLASALCRVAGKDVPIRPGASEPLLVAQRQPEAPQADTLDRWPHGPAESFPPGEAIELLRQTIRRHPGEVVLLAIGPLTNVALLFRADPEIPGLLGGLVTMGGSFAERPDADPRDWNILLDPHAAAIVYRAEIPTHRSVGLDVSMKVTMPREEVRRRFQVPLLRPVLDFSEVGYQEREGITFHDPLAGATIFDEGLCGFRSGSVEVELEPGRRFGKTTFVEGAGDGRHEVALEVDPARFFEHYFGVLDASHETPGP